MGEQRHTQQIQIAHGVEDFVFHKLIVIAQSVRIEHLIVVHDDGIVQPTAQRQAVLAHHFYVFGKAKGAGPRNIARIRTLAQVEVHALPGRVHGRVRKVDCETELKAMVGL